MESRIKWHKVDDVPNDVFGNRETLILERSGRITVIGSCIYEGKWHFNAFVSLSGLYTECEFDDVVAWAWLPDVKSLLKWAVNDVEEH